MTRNRRVKAIGSRYGGASSKSDTCAAGFHLSRRNPERYGQPTRQPKLIRKDVQAPTTSTRRLIGAPSRKADAAVILRGNEKSVANPTGRDENGISMRITCRRLEHVSSVTHAF